MASITRFAGLYTSANELSSVPSGALARADNVVIRDGDLHPRRGQYSMSGPALTELFFYAGKDFAAAATHLYRDLGATDLGAYAAPDPTVLRMKFVEAMQSLWFTTSDGIKVIESATGAVQSAGCPKAYGTHPVWSTDTANVYAMAYRATWCRKDANGRVIEGAPCGREIYHVGSTSSFSVGLVYMIPPEITTSHWLRVYRTEVTTTAIGPSEEYYLAYEYTPTSGDIAVGYTNTGAGKIVDSTPDALLGALAYFSASQGGELETNDRPPLAKDACVLGDRVLYANTRLSQSLTLSYLGGLHDGDTITVAGRTYVARAYDPFNPPDPTHGEFTLDTLFLSPSETAAWAMTTLAAAINLDTLSTIHATYVADTNVFGTILLESKALDASAWSVTVSARGNSWLPALPTSGATVQSSDDYAPNRVYYSKLRQPEAVPSATHYVDVGAKNKKILRIVECREKVYVFKEDGVFSISGSAPYRVEPLDKTVILIAPDSAVAVANVICAFTNQGVVEVSESGVRVLSGPIADELRFWVHNSTAYAYQIFGVASETDRQYQLWLLDASTGATVNHAYILNNPGGGAPVWTHWTGLSRTCGRVAPLDHATYPGRLLMGVSGGGIAVENRRFDAGDYADTNTASPSYSLTTASVSTDGNTLTTTTPHGLAVGDIVVGNNAAYGKVASAPTITSFTLEGRSGTFTGGVTLWPLKGYLCKLEALIPVSDGPFELKQAATATYAFGHSSFYGGKATFKTELSSGEATAALYFGDRAVQGAVGAAPTRAPARATPRNKEVGIPQAKQLGAYLSVGFEITEARGWWSLHGINTEVTTASHRNSR